MTAPQETIVNETAREESPALAVEIPSTRALPGAEFLDDSWAEEFDRRLAAWQAEAPPAAVVETILQD